MRRAVVLMAIMLLTGCGPAANRDTGVPSNFALTSTTIALPAEPILLPPSAARVALNCTACHSGEMILAQPRLDAKKWQAEIDKMRSVFKASIDTADDPKLIAELTALQGSAANAH